MLINILKKLPSSRAQWFHGSRRLDRTVPFLLADIGEGIAEVEVLEWHVKEGQQVGQFDKIAEVQSDKATVEITSRFDGLIKKIHYEKGAMARVGSPLVDIEVEGDEEGVPVANESSKPVEKTNLSQKIENRASHSTFTNSTDTSATATKVGFVKAMPGIRNLAKQLGVDINKVQPTGNSGQVTREDIERAAAAPEKQTIDQRHQVDNPAHFEAVSLKAFQKAMVRSMQSSLAIPHFGYSEEILVDRLIDLRREIMDVVEARHRIKLTPMSFYLKALSLVLQEFPSLNAHFDASNERLKLYQWHNMAIAVDTNHGLAVPVVKAVQSQSIVDIARELARLTEAARLNRLDPKDLRDGTITVSNIGTIGGTGMSPVIMAPQVAIVAMGQARIQPGFDEKTMELLPRQVLPIAWSADHRVVDGATIAKLTRRWKELIEKPSQLLLYLQTP